MIGDQTQHIVRQRMSAFFLIWIGQLASIIGSGLTRFVLGIWIYEQTGSITLFVLMALFDAIPGIIVSPFAGALVDRWNRRSALIISDSIAAISTLLLMLLIINGQLTVGLIYVAISISSICNAFQWPAYAATIPLLVPKQHLGRANGMVQAADAIARILSPILAVILMGVIDLQGVLLVDIVTFLFALSMLCITTIPSIASDKPPRSFRAFLQEVVQGWTYIRTQTSLYLLLWFSTVTNFTLGVVQVLLAPLVLTFASTEALGLVLSIAGGGALAGGILMSLWGGPEKRIYGIFGFTLLQGFLLLLGGLQPNISLIAVASSLFLFCTPLIYGCNQSIWQSKVPFALQGRIFATQRMMIWISLACAYLIAGPLADGVFEPLMAVDGLLSSTVGQLIGVGPGRGIGFLFILIGIITIGITVWGFLSPTLRFLEERIPDIESTNLAE